MNFQSSHIFRSRLLRWMLLTGVFFLLLMSLLRLVFNWVFKPDTETGLSRAFWMGMRYDARVVCIFLLIAFIGGLIFYKQSFSGKWAKRFLLIYSRFFGVLIIFLYTFDFAHFAYLRQRLNASILSYADDAFISARMVWQSYPVIKIVLGWIIGFVLIFYATRYLYKRSAMPETRAGWKNKLATLFPFFLVLGLAIFGRVSKFPLRWSDAYRLNSDYKASLALNPFQSFISSLKFRSSSYDLAQTKKYYPLMTEQLGITNPDSVSLNFLRTTTGDSASRKPNIVLVICESFSAYKSSMWGNPLNTTPYFNELCKQGIFFNNCFTPAYGTARGVWALITGIPDVTEYKTASRNPRLVDQQTVLNDIKGYEKFYFIGGSASWANIRGVLEANVKDLHLYEQEDYSAKGVDVWGISDKNLFLEANKVISKQDKPFFAIIQTADNHRPYTIPAEDRPFVKMQQFPQDTLKKYGFWTNEELNAFSYMDYTYKTFIEAAQKEKYFDNTLFVFIGDHGIRGSAGNMMPKVWTDQSLTLWHVPLLFYAPSKLRPQVVEHKVSQVDVIPSIAALAGLPVRNTTLGRNIFADTASLNNSRNHAFVFDFDLGLAGLVSKDYYYQVNLKTKKEGVYSLLHNNPLSPGEPSSNALDSLRQLTLGYFETSRYLLFNNKKR
ncbi:MAG: LTA synthase family protein [Bacteroidetes bacterium]|nr:LTA synthase family protein [Bacteroidota bacterium]